MSRVVINTLRSPLISRRAYSAAAESTARIPSAAALPRAAQSAAESGGSAKQEVFWMRDPETGYWVPEKQTQDADPAELRARQLPKQRYDGDENTINLARVFSTVEHA